VDQLNKILEVLGTPNEKTIHAIKSDRAQKYVRSLPFKEPKLFAKMMPSAETDAIDLLSQLINFDPTERLNVACALEHPWLASFHETINEPVCHSKYEKWRYIESLETLEEFREAIWNEVQEFREEVRNLSFLLAPRDDRPPTRLSRTADSLDRGSIPSTERNVACPEELATEFQSTTLTDTSGSEQNGSSTAADPMTVYGDARRASILQPVAEDSTLPASSPSEHKATSQHDSVSHHGHARTRTTSMMGGRLLRSLSTISVHEYAEDTAQLAAKAPVGRYIVEKSAADAPPSELPKEFG